MRKQLLIYLPSLVLLVVAMVLPQMGRNFVGTMNGREFALFLAFWWTMLAAGFHLVRWMVRGLRNPGQVRGFDVVPIEDGESAAK